MEDVKNLATQGIEPNGGGALSSDYVCKLGSKICHLERSERSQTHPSLPLEREGTQINFLPQVYDFCSKRLIFYKKSSIIDG